MSQWHQVALTWKSGGEVVLYLDGKAVGRQAAAKLPDPFSVLIGRTPPAVNTPPSTPTRSGCSTGPSRPKK
jgi:hypothetical protein